MTTANSFPVLPTFVILQHCVGCLINALNVQLRPSCQHGCSSFCLIDILVFLVFSKLKMFCIIRLLLFIYAPSFVIGIDSARETVHKTFNGCQLSYQDSALLVDWISHMNCRHSTLSSLLLEEQRSLEQAVQVLILLSTDTERLITAFGASWRKIAVWSLEMTQLQRPLALWCFSKVRVVMVGFRWQMAVTTVHFQGWDLDDLFHEFVCPSDPLFLFSCINDD